MPASKPTEPTKLTSILTTVVVWHVLIRYPKSRVWAKSSEPSSRVNDIVVLAVLSRNGRARGGVGEWEEKVYYPGEGSRVCSLLLLLEQTHPPTKYIYLQHESLHAS